MLMLGSYAKGLKGEETTRMRFISTLSRMPGFDVQPLRSLPMPLCCQESADFGPYVTAPGSEPYLALQDAKGISNNDPVPWEEENARLVRDEGLCSMPEDVTVLPFVV